MTRFTGGCLCGDIRYEADGEIVRMARCHCNDCRRGTGASFATNVFVPVDALKITQGEPKTFQHPTDSGGTMTRKFCPRCGSPLFGQSSNSPNTWSIRAGSIDDAGFVRPTIEVYTSRALACTALGEDTTHYRESRPR